jgi:hypothetical protein
MTGGRLAWLAALLACCGTGALAACTGRSSASPGGDDAGVPEAAAQDDATQPRDAGPADGAHEASLKGACEPVRGACDLVLQDCPSGSQCAAQPLADGGYTAACGPTYGVQHIAAGYPCCPPAAPADDPCLPGLQCVGDPCAGDAGDAGGGGRCSPYCCAGDDTPCGVSPEGFAGHCDIGVVDNAGTPLYDVCEYAPTCEPLGLLPCPAGYTCLVEDTTGGAKCSPIYNGGAPPAGEGQPCPHDNACQSGLMCLRTSGPEGGSESVCLMLCYTGQGAPPFDAGALGMMPGTGTCNPGKTCASATQIFPAWLGVCI